MPARFVTLADFDDQPVRWLWPNYIPVGVTMLEGLPESFKTYVLSDVAARITTGRPMPLSDATSPVGDVLILNAEDPVASQRKRLKLAGADLSRVHIPEANYRPVFPEALPDLERMVANRNVRLVVFDPLASYAAAPLSSDVATRRLMDSLTAFAQRTTTAVVGVRHWTKTTSAQPIYRAAGSHSVTAAVRSELIIGEDPHDRGRRVVAQLKNNLAPLAPSVSFRPISQSDGVTIEWSGPCALSARDLMDVALPRDRPQLEEAKDVLFSILGEGPVTARAVESRAREAGVSSSKLRRAKKELGVLSKRQGFGPDSMFYWELPSHDDPAVKARWDAEVDRLTDQLCHGEQSGVTIAGDPGEPRANPDWDENEGPDDESGALAG